MQIKIPSLQASELSRKSLNEDYLYKDLFLDLKPQVYLNRQLNKTQYLKDVEALYDLESVKNSIRTAFLTSPGDKILNPTYGVDLRQYLFEPIDEFTIDIIKDTIMNKLPIMEPRVQLEMVNVYGNEDENTIYIELQINVPSLGVYGLSLKSELNSVGYVIL